MRWIKRLYRWFRPLPPVDPRESLVFKLSDLGTMDRRRELTDAKSVVVGLLREAGQAQQEAKAK